MATNEVRRFELKSWDDFIAQVRVNHFAADRVFRGHRDPTWKLSSVWERWLDRMKGGDSERNVRSLFSPGAFERIRDGYLPRFMDLAIGLPDVDTRGLGEGEWLLLARHSGLISPLLDWTKSPYVAAYHAFADLIRHLNPGFGQ